MMQNGKLVTFDVPETLDEFVTIQQRKDIEIQQRKKSPEELEQLKKDLIKEFPSMEESRDYFFKNMPSDLLEEDLYEIIPHSYLQ